MQGATRFGVQELARLPEPAAQAGHSRVVVVVVVVVVTAGAA